MDVVLLLLVIAGIALIAVPRLQRRRAGTRRPPARAARRTRKPARAAATAAAPVATWTPATGGEWDDDLGWEGVDAPAPPPVEEEPAREPDRAAWERWRAAQAPEAAEAAGDELPSVARWRELHGDGAPRDDFSAAARWREGDAAGDDWLEDDDGLGWEGESAASPTPAAPPNGRNGHAAPANGAAPVAHPAPGATAPFADGRSAPVTGDGATVPFANGHPTPVAGHGAPSADDRPAPAAYADALPGVAGRRWGADGVAWEVSTDTRPEPRAAAPRRGRRMSPVLLVALYAAAGLIVVGLVSTLLLGGSSKPASATKAAATATATPRATATPASTPTPAPTVDPAVVKARQAAAARARHAFARSHRAVLLSERRAVARARAALKRRRAAAAARRRAARTTHAAPVTPVVTPAPTVTSPAPQQSYSAPAPTHHSGGGSRGPDCEFCIG